MKIYGMSRQEAAKKLSTGQITVAVYGLGKMGLPLSAVFANKGADVIGVDISPQVVELINQGKSHVIGEPGLEELVQKVVLEKKLRATTDTSAAVKSADLIIVLVPTLITQFKRPDVSAVENVMQGIAENLQEATIVVTECTMPPGSTESFIPLLEKSGLKCGVNFGLAHCPERTMSGTALRDIQHQYVKIVGAINQETLEPLCGVYETINDKGVYPVSSIKVAEAVKVYEGIHRDVNIALANELASVSKKLGIDSMEAIAAANTQPFCHIHKPGCGVGGHCTPVYPLFIMDEDTSLIETARRVNDAMPRRFVKLLMEAAGEAGKPLKGLNVLVFGLTYRGGVKEFINTPAKVIVEDLEKLGCNVYAYDPLCDEKDARQFGVILDNRLENLEIIDCVAITTDAAEFKSLDWEAIVRKMKTKIVVDGRQLISPEVVRREKAIYKGIGRL